jgi:hypothetical protein
MAEGEDAVTEAERAPLALAAPTAAMSARLTSKLYLPTALVAMQLPAGLADLQKVPRLLPPDEWHDEEARLQEYVEAIRATARVFATYNHKMETLASYDSYMVWIDGWARLSGFKPIVEVDLEVRAERAGVRARRAVGANGLRVRHGTLPNMSLAEGSVSQPTLLHSLQLRFCGGTIRLHTFFQVF